MSYATDLLDGFEILYKRTEGVLKCNLEMSNFFKKLSLLEAEYSKALLKLVKSTGQKKLISNPFLDGSLKESWKVSLTELEQIGNQHFVFSNLNNDLSTNIEKMVKEKENTRKKLTNDGQKLTKDMKAQLEVCTKAKLNYHKLSKDAEVAHTLLTKGQADPKMKQDKHFEEDRIVQSKDNLEKLAIYVKEIPPVVQHAFEGIERAAQQVDKDSDIRQWVSENRTGVSVPAHIEYHSYEGEVSSTSSPNNFRVGTYKPPVTQIKEWGLTSKDQSLSPPEKIAKLEQQYQEISQSIRNEVQARSGIEKLIQFYANDPKEQKKAEGELAEADKKIHSLKESQKLITVQLEELGKSNPQVSSDFANSSHSVSTIGNSGAAINGASGGNTGGGQKVVRVKGLYDYEASCDTELSFREGEILTVTEQDSSGWWYSISADGKNGFIPANYCQVLDSTDQ
ncbi:hypothetical protein DICPUDRAFT_152774 [Dictyostelium purpureum]|uniref:SH3 domain-containing protein n=1 Tax=Dictyostelium purpureum TaxID=5786 RepID=F0ZM88_DICPU|nr:uncharacterized protein DICPUDRAFT_152774 [Dictyostelium purpureum]EGC34954.1 hypothetical protein DICPUDRAFT_152774 [Dictyostelium purpureum]|eukprot:XP_003288535.1 hypothetical protein DICPUDRAFT_152774 [Dictyostelium purpureum]